jgi:hypothetical protein
VKVRIELSTTAADASPVVVVKDVGGFVADYQSQTEIYRVSGREVRLHECRSACTLALSLPNVCVYKDSTLKFHLAYDPHDHAVNPQISQQMFNSYPAAVRARLGSLTREYKVLHGTELIALGIRDCDAPQPGGPKIMVASASHGKSARAAAPDAQQPPFAGIFNEMLTVFGIGGANQNPSLRAASSLRPSSPQKLQLAEIPLPPERPPEFGRQLNPQGTSQAQASSGARSAAGPPAEAEKPEQAQPREYNVNPGHGAKKLRLPAIITGAQPILPPRFSAYAQLDR